MALPWETFLGNLQAGIPPDLQDTQPLEDGEGHEDPHASSQPNEPQESAAAAASADAAAGAATTAVKAEGEAGAPSGGAAKASHPWRLLEGGGACKVLAKSEMQQCTLTGGWGRCMGGLRWRAPGQVWLPVLSGLPPAC